MPVSEGSEKIANATFANVDAGRGVFGERFHDRNSFSGLTQRAATMLGQPDVCKRYRYQGGADVAAGLAGLRGTVKVW